ncbi:MAG: hypothetical protein JU82_08540 [Sulfuricurvum sp. MLSB]|uniref:hypothetical protein n=1 Tax=unclassified Sulfuricurvum TaxID=2632390 RepID=UPI000508C5AC|nr:MULTISPECIES: hypothetical protein [unclassified Sulfuricurvum]KFN39074.1 MAG: hypothetical protein JU82_08540 [Sulfuricurvum sp. MLSB]
MQKKYSLSLLSIISITLIAFTPIENNFFKIDKLLSIEINKPTNQDENVENAKKKTAFLAGFIAVEGSDQIIDTNIYNDGRSFLSTIDQLEAKAKVCGFTDKLMFDHLRDMTIPKVDKFQDYVRMRTQLEAHLETTPILLSAYKTGVDLEVLLKTVYSNNPAYGTIQKFHNDLQKDMKNANINLSLSDLSSDSEINIQNLQMEYFELFRTIQKSQKI